MTEKNTRKFAEEGGSLAFAALTSWRLACSLSDGISQEFEQFIDQIRKDNAGLLPEADRILKDVEAIRIAETELHWIHSRGGFFRRRYTQGLCC